MMQEDKLKNILTGFVSVGLKENDDLNKFCSRLAGYNAERFEAVALRLYTGNETIVTIYAHDKSKPVTEDEPRLKVHKFKIEISLPDFASQLDQLNFTVNNNKYDMWEMEVMNK